MRCLYLAVALLVACGGKAANTPDAGDPNSDGGTGSDGGPDETCIASDPFQWPVETGPVTITASATWKNQVSTSDEPFLSPRTQWDNDEIRWIKFAVLTEDPSKVYFQDSSTLTFHYDFATAHLDPFIGMSHAEFDQISLYEEGQQIILGALLFPPNPDQHELAVQLVRQDPYHPEMVKTIVELVASGVTKPEGTTVFYSPTFEQAESATACRAWFDGQGIPVDSASRWITTNSCYSAGWALGTVVSVAGSDIEAAYRAGTLKPNDILLTDGVPAEVPFVAGILTKAPSTPNSHVALLARSYGVPFAYLSPDDAERADSLVGKEIVLRAEATYYAGCNVRLIDVEGQLSNEERQEILALKDPPVLAIQSIASYGSYSGTTTGLTRSDVRFFGGKAANFGLLRAAIPDNSPDAIAFSFDLWTEFLDQTMPSSNTLRQEIASRLSGFTYPPDMAAVADALSEIRDMIKSQATFTSSQQTAVLSALSGFDPVKKIRFRSSTNVEDTDAFIGAGLYSSISGCLADDQDGDDAGPSLCNAQKPDERGVFRAIQKVYASFYNTNAYLERLRHGVDESQVGMALLVHHSFPDEIELANGVAVGRHSTYSDRYDLVSQLGATSVANPEGGAIPEIVQVVVGSLDVFTTFKQGSSLVQLGAKILDWLDEYEQLGRLLKSVTDLYASRNPSLEQFTLDFEYKKVEPADLVVKQVRRLPAVDSDKKLPIYLFDEPKKYCVFQGEYSTVFANHRLKSIWQISTTSQWMNSTTLQQSFLANVDLDYLANTTVQSMSGDPATWPGATHNYDGNRTTDSFSIGSGPSQRDFTLDVAVETEVSASWIPLRVLDDHPVYARVDYATPVPVIDWDGVGTTSTEYVRLSTCSQDNVVTSANPLVEETISAGGVTVATSYYWPPPPRGITAGYTAPLVKWNQTTITGLTSAPIVLTGHYSQTYRPEHHNFGSNYIFDPWLEPGIAQSVLDELQTNNVRFLFIDRLQEIWTLSLDGVLTKLE